MGQPSKYSSMLAGVCVDQRFNDAYANLVKQAGISWIRTDLTFSTSFQRTYSTANTHGLNIIGILDYQTLDRNSSFTLGDWEHAVARAKATYPSIRVWEIWNEPTVIAYRLGYMDGTPEHYLDLLKSAYSILKAGTPDSVVLGLGGAIIAPRRPQDLDFARSVFNNGGGAVMDAISIHAYPSLLNIGKTWDYYEQLWTQELQQYKQFGKPFWVTETGSWSNQMTEEDQATFLKNGYLFFQRQGASALIWFQLIDYMMNGTLVACGLFQRDMTQKPAYTTYAMLIAMTPRRRR
jgi:hypothetical protein